MHRNVKRFFIWKLSCTEQTAPLRSYEDTSRRIRKLNKHPIDALILHRGGILAHSRGREKDSGERNDCHLHEALVQRIRRTERRETARSKETWQSEWTDYTAYRVLAGLNEYCRRYPGVPNSTLLPTILRISFVPRVETRHGSPFVNSQLIKFISDLISSIPLI